MILRAILAPSSSLALAVLFMPRVSGALPDTVERQLGNRTIKLAVPPGLSDWTDRDSPVVRTAKALLPATHELIALFAREGSASYSSIQVLKGLKEREVSSSDFAALLRETKAGLEAGTTQAAVKRLVDQINKEQPAKDLDIEVKFGEPVLLPVFSESSMHLSWPMISKTRTSQDTAAEQNTVAATATLLWLNRRVILVYQYVPFDGPKSLQALKESSTRYAKDLMHLNGIPT
jgi:hypothetical protein